MPSTGRFTNRTRSTSFCRPARWYSSAFCCEFAEPRQVDDADVVDLDVREGALDAHVANGKIAPRALVVLDLVVGRVGHVLAQFAQRDRSLSPVQVAFVGPERCLHLPEPPEDCHAAVLVTVEQPKFGLGGRVLPRLKVARGRRGRRQAEFVMVRTEDLVAERRKRVE
jgi:hypothetical protein